MLSQTVMADNKTDAETLLKSKLDAVISVLQQKELGKETKNGQILEIVTPSFDFSLMAKLALGKKYWPGLARDKQEEYTDVFVKRLKETYLEKLNLYTDEQVVYLATVESGNKIHIPTELISKGSKIIILYKLYKSNHGWKIYDVEVEGVSVVSTYRSQFDQILSTGTIDDLLLKIGKTGNASAKPAESSKVTAGQSTK